MRRLGELALRRGALTGLFDVDALVSGVLPPDADDTGRDAIIAELAPSCTERLLDGAWLWEVTADSRRAVLRDFISAPSLLLAVRESPPARQGDGFGTALQALLTGQVPQPPKRPAGQSEGDWLRTLSIHHADVLSAAEVAAVVPALDATAIAEIDGTAQSQIKLLQRRRDLQIVLPTRLHGRSYYQDRLSRFLRGKDGPDSRPLLLTGIGGAGKSALLAQLVNGWRNKTGAPLTVRLDFDREVLRAGEPVRIVGEALRQLATSLVEDGGLDKPVLDRLVDGLSQLRHDLPATDEQGRSRDFQSQVSRLSTEYLSRLQDDWAAPLKDVDIALIMDSFEAMGRKSGVAVSTVANLEQELRIALPNLRCIISGRSAPMEEPELTERVGPPSRRLRLGGLGPVSGGRMIEDHDAKGFFQTPAQREQASQILGGHPLALIVLARYVQRLSDPPEKLMGDLARDANFKAEFAQVFLYTRILDRISDGEIGKLAHPGLVLRRLNADLIRLVLAEPCLGHPVTPTEAADLIERLREEYWLVEPATAPFDLRHQPDLRRPMLPGLFAGPGAIDSHPDDIERKTGLAAKARQVARSAAELFQSGPHAEDAAFAWWNDMPMDTRSAEAAYYRALAGDPVETFDQRLASVMFATLGEDIETMPRDWQVRISALRSQDVAAEDIDLLDGALRQEALQRLSQAARKVGAGAATKVGSRPDAPPAQTGAGPTDDSIPSIEEFDTLLASNLSVRATPLNFGIAGSDGDAMPLGSAPPSGISALPGAAWTELAAEVRAAFDAARFEDNAFQHLVTQCLILIGRTGRPSDATTFVPDAGFAIDNPIWFVVLYAATMSDPLALVPDYVRPETLDQYPFALAILRPTGPAIHDAFKVAQSRSPTDLNPTLHNRLVRRNAFRWLASRPFDLVLDRAEETHTETTLQCNAFALGVAIYDGDRPVTLADLVTGADGPAEKAAPDETGLDRLAAVLRGTLDNRQPPSLRLFGEAYSRSMGLSLLLTDLPAVEPDRQDLLRRMVRGLSPELHNPVISVLVSLDVAQVTRIMQHLESLSPNWPRELRLDDSRAYRDVQAPTVVEIADQCGLLRELCDVMAQYDARSSRLVAMHDRITAWFFADDALDDPPTV